MNGSKSSIGLPQDFPCFPPTDFGRSTLFAKLKRLNFTLRGAYPSSALLVMQIHQRTAVFLSLLTLSSASAAVSLGDLTVQSRPGEPLEARLEINDVDLSVSPLEVRVAPPDAYRAAGVEWQKEVAGIRIARDPAGSGITVRVAGDEAMPQAGLPLLIELNAGGAVTLREYQIVAKEGGYEVVPTAERTKLSAKSEPKQAAEAPKPKRVQKSARRLVREAADRTGFTPEKAFKVESGMTLWSIGRIYWPAYPGTTMEQLLLAFVDRNPSAFEDGKADRIIVGATLEPPLAEDVFAVPAEAAFRNLRGDMVVPLSTRNLIDAQSVSIECARKVAEAQNAERRRGGSAQSIAQAGRTAFEEEKARILQARTLSGDERAGAPVARTEPAAEAASPVAVEEPREASSTTEAEVAEPTVEEKPDAKPQAAPERSASSEKTVEPAVDAKADAEDASKPAPQPEAADSDRTWLWIAGALLLLLAGFFLLRRKEEQKPEIARAPKPVEIQRDVKPSSEAQLEAVKAVVSEAVRKGTTAGAMGAGEAAFAASQTKEAPADQPWLDPNDDELPPLDVEEAKRHGPADLPEAVRAIDLDLEEKKEEKAPQPVLQKPSEYVPPLAPEPIEPPQADPEPAETANPPADPSRPTNEREAARTQAYGAKLKLANSFIGLGAVKEARELLEEVRRHGSDAQREQAEFLLSRIE